MSMTFLKTLYFPAHYFTTHRYKHNNRPALVVVSETPPLTSTHNRKQETDSQDE